MSHALSVIKRVLEEYEAKDLHEMQAPSAGYNFTAVEGLHGIVCIRKILSENPCASLTGHLRVKVASSMFLSTHAAHTNSEYRPFYIGSQRRVWVSIAGILIEAYYRSIELQTLVIEEQDCNARDVQQ